MKRLLVLLTDPVKAFYEKGEIKPRYYNPGDLFDEVHLVSPARHELDPEKVTSLVGRARMVLHPLGPWYAATGFLPFGRLGRLMRAVKPDAIRAYDAGPRGSLAVVWGKRLGVPSVVSVHADCDDQRRHERRWTHRARALLERYALPRADAVVCVSRYVASYAKRHGAKEPTVIYNKVYAEQFGGREGAAAGRNGGPRRLRVMSVGRLVPQKDQACLIRSLREIPAALTLIGDGLLREELKRLANTLGVGDRVQFIRAVPHGEIAAAYHQADVFAMATHYEGFCIPVLEAMAAGLPVVASRIGPIEEIVGDAGMLVDNTPGSFASALERLAREPDLRRQLGERARARALTMDGTAMESQERALYESLCGNAP